MTKRNCHDECTNKDNIKKYDITKGLPPTVKNRLEKKKCTNCSIWMRIDSWNCFCCGQQLSKRRKKASKLIDNYHNNYPSFADLNMTPIHVEMRLKRQ